MKTCNQLLICLVLLSGCNVFDEEEAPERDLMAEIRSHAETFKVEAAQRGVDVTSEMASIVFEIKDEILYDGQSLCGFAPWYDDPDTTDRTLSFVVDERCWTSRPIEDNEALVFHELGHMVLDRFHRDELLPNNSRSSIMVSTNLAGLYAGNAKSRRAYYIDELFDENTPVPDWAK